MSDLPKCRHCGVEMVSGHLSRRYCSPRCKTESSRLTVKTRGEHNCRQCGKTFQVGPGENNKWICSVECRKARLAQSVREFHTRRPTQQALYRLRQKDKQLPDSVLIRFYRWYPEAPRACESCGEDRILDIAHKPDFVRLGEHRSKDNCVWPTMVWVLCPTCHGLLDRMNYTPAELGLL